MIRKALFLLAPIFLLGIQFSTAQEITAQKQFTTSYPVQTLGYPSKVVPTVDGNYAYIEYWSNGEGRKFENYYLQSYNAEFEEEWFSPITAKGAARLDITDLHRMDKGIAVLGKQYSPATKNMATKMQIFGFDGLPKGGLIKLSNYDKKAKKGFEDYFDISPDASKLLWMGHNPDAKYKKRRYFLTVWGSNGQMTWGKNLILPFVGEKYRVKQAVTDNRGHAYFLMTYETVTNTLKDTVNLPILLRYDFREKKFTDYQMKFSGASVPESRIHINEKGDLVFVGILSDGSEGGFLNGANSFGEGLKWNKIVYKQFNIERELMLSQEYLIDIPEDWTKKYATRGADFSKAEIIEHKGRLYWIMEEFYATTHNKQLQFRYYDVATVAIDMKNGTILWANNFEKKQRDYKSGRLLSYVTGLTKTSLNFVYLNERGAQGRIVCTSLDLETGANTQKDLVRNERADFLFFPKRSSMVDKNKMILMGVGDTNRNDYKLIEITF